MLYTTKPVVIEAVEFNEEKINEYPMVNVVGNEFYLSSLQGVVRLDNKDFIITEHKEGFYYPCKPEVFWSKYKEI